MGAAMRQPNDVGTTTLNELIDGDAKAAFEHMRETAAVIAEFKRLGDKASFHYADDSTKEWHLADKAKVEALAIFDAHPELHEQMREVARSFLWLLSVSRPVQP